MRWNNKIQSIIQSPCFFALILLFIFMATVGYKFGWDDQHIEIPLLKSLINPNLYQGDYYVESLKKNFTSFFYPLLANIITIKQIPFAYFFLFLLSRYFLFFWIYKIWLFITKDRLKSFLCVLVFIFITRVDEFLYKTFSHQEFALALIFSGIYFFLKSRFLLSAIILGISANFHALYSLFPFFYMCVYLLWQIRKEGVKPLLKVLGGFIICSLPFLIWMVQNRLNHSSIDVSHYSDWQGIYHYACPQNFLLPLIPPSKLLGDLALFLNATRKYLILIGLYFLNIFFNEKFKENKKAQGFCIGAFVLLFLCLIFTYIHPNKFFLDLNLTRNTQFLLFLLIGYTLILITNIIETKKHSWGLCFAILFVLLKYSGLVSTFAAFIMLGVLLFDSWFKKPKSIIRYLILSISVIAIAASAVGIIYSFIVIPYRFFVLLNLTIILTSFALTYLALGRCKDLRTKKILLKAFYVIPLVLFFYQYSFYNYKRVQAEKNNPAFWQVRRSWEDVQKFVKLNTPVDATIFVPFDVFMGGFRIHSEREIVVSERDCGIVGFDFNAALEWKKRAADLRLFNVAPEKSPTPAIKKAILKYGANYVVFMRYAAPGKSRLLKKVYTNMDFVLYRVTVL